MLTWWLSLGGAEKILYEWLFGVAITAIIMAVSIVQEYYVEYTSFLEGKINTEPSLLHADGGEAAGLLIVILLAIILWPISLVVFLVVQAKKLKLVQIIFTQILNPGHWIRRLAIRRNKALVLTSPKEHIRQLAGRKSK